MSDLPQAKKSLGQHWLNDPASLEAIVKAARITKNDAVLEIGPGPGALTAVLARTADKVIAVELDPILAHTLPSRVKADNLEVIIEDILDFDFRRLPTGYKLVANIPYYLTSNLIRILSESINPPVVAALLVQKEVAERINAGPGAMSILSVSAQFYWQVSLDKVVTANLFKPPPKVDSQIVVLTRREEALFAAVEPKVFFRVVKAGFSQRRKTLLNSLSAGLRLDRAMVEAACQAAKVDSKRRAQTLSLEEWHQLYLALI